MGVFFSVLAFLPLPWNEPLENVLIDQCFKLRGPRAMPENLVTVAIGAQDIQALGGWPLTRDYYAYILHFLASRGARTIGFDLLWDQPHPRYPEHDATLGTLLATFHNVCLPMVFSDFEPAMTSSPARGALPQSVFIGDRPLFPLPAFHQHSAGIGFSNFARTPLPRQMPLLAVFDDSVQLSLGAELARLFLGGTKEPDIRPRALVLFDSSGTAHETTLDDHGRMRLNHFGDWHDLNSVTFLELLRMSQNNPDSLAWSGKLVLVAVTDPTLTTIKATPFAEALPAGVLHLTVAENIIRQNYLREARSGWQVIIVFLLVGAMAGLAQKKNLGFTLAAGSGVVLAYTALAVGLFARMNFVLPLFYPLLAGLAMLLGIVYTHQRRHSGWEAVQRGILQEQMALKQAQLEEIEIKLAVAQKESAQHAAFSEKERQFVEEQKQKILALEKQLRDLQVYEQAGPDPFSQDFAEIVCAPGGAMGEVLATVKKLADHDLPVLICGETGTGKELIAHAIHHTGTRRHQPFLAINCSALPESLLESELFGHEKGSFTGAHAQRRGRFDLANGGTLFLDEITETSPALQARLLRVLQDGTFERVGGEQTIKADVRFIAACNRDLQKEIEQGRFRADLFYRLNGFQIVLPPLRERSEDIPSLVHHFLHKHGHHKVVNVSSAAMAALQNHDWPGNVRELENAVRRAAVLAQSEGRSLIQIEDLPKEVREEKQLAPHRDLYRALPEQILEMLRAVKFTRNAISQTARALGNRDRGTITEYFRGMCFEQLVRAEFDLEAAARGLAGTAEEEVVSRVRIKIEEYLKNVHAASALVADQEEAQAKIEQCCKGLPRRYHAFVQQIFTYLQSHASPREFPK
jgi:transcriptional regulator with GAF, ATPase, and Fis domain/CHASE2 domain-containing sensor protein